MGRGFERTISNDEIEDTNDDALITSKSNDPEAATYSSMLTDKKTLVLCLTGWSFHFANANVLLCLLYTSPSPRD